MFVPAVETRLNTQSTERTSSMTIATLANETARLRAIHAARLQGDISEASYQKLYRHQLKLMANQIKTAFPPEECEY